MVTTVMKIIVTDVGYLSNWPYWHYKCLIHLQKTVVAGRKTAKMSRELMKKSRYTFLITMGNDSHSETLHYWMEKRALRGKTTIYDCYDKTCKQPVLSIPNALDLLPAV